MKTDDRGWNVVTYTYRGPAGKGHHSIKYCPPGEPDLTAACQRAISAALKGFLDAPDPKTRQHNRAVLEATVEVLVGTLDELDSQTEDLEDGNDAEQQQHSD